MPKKSISYRHAAGWGFGSTGDERDLILQVRTHFFPRSLPISGACEQTRTVVHPRRDRRRDVPSGYARKCQHQNRNWVHIAQDAHASDCPVGSNSHLLLLNTLIKIEMPTISLVSQPLGRFTDCNQ